MLFIGLVIGLIIGVVLGEIGLHSYKRYLKLKIDDCTPTDFKVDGKLKFAYLVSEDMYLERIISRRK